MCLVKPAVNPHKDLTQVQLNISFTNSVFFFPPLFFGWSFSLSVKGMGPCHTTSLQESISSFKNVPQVRDLIIDFKTAAKAKSNLFLGMISPFWKVFMHLTCLRELCWEEGHS